MRFSRWRKHKNNKKALAIQHFKTPKTLPTIDESFNTIAILNKNKFQFEDVETI